MSAPRVFWHSCCYCVLSASPEPFPWFCSAFLSATLLVGWPDSASQRLLAASFCCLTLLLLYASCSCCFTLLLHLSGLLSCCARPDYDVWIFHRCVSSVPVLHYRLHLLPGLHVLLAALPSSSQLQTVTSNGPSRRPFCFSV